jgi:hypothetical protein
VLILAAFLAHYDMRLLGLRRGHEPLAAPPPTPPA